MNEDFKLGEARYFLGHLAGLNSDAVAFAYELSAFLTAAQSVVGYANTDAGQKGGAAQAWFIEAIRANPEIAYFKEKRRVSVHLAPVVPSINVQLPPLMIPIPENPVVTVRVDNPDGSFLEQTQRSQSRPPRLAAAPGVATISYHFVDRPGVTVEAFCAKYLEAVEAIVEEGRARGFLSSSRRFT